MRCRYMERSTLTSEHDHEGIVNPLPLLNCPSLTTECICWNPSGLGLHWCSKAILQQSCLLQKKSCFCQALILGMGNLWRFLSPAPAEILNCWSAASGRTIRRFPCLLAWCSDPDLHLILCLWLCWNSHQDFMHSLIRSKHPPAHFPFSGTPQQTCFLIIC